jgi:hypothetical protein
MRIGKEIDRSQTDWSVQLRREDFELYWRTLFGAGDSALDVPGPGFSLRFSKGRISAGGLRGLTPQALGRRLSVFSLDGTGNAPTVGPGANVEGVSFELGEGNAGGFVSIAHDKEGIGRKSAFVSAPIGEGRMQLCAGAFVSDEGAHEVSFGGRASLVDVLFSTGKTIDGPETSLSIREVQRRAAVRATWRDGPEGRICTLAFGAGISRGRFSATRVEISGSPLAGAIRDSRSRGVLRSVWGPWRIFAGADSRRLDGGTSSIRGNLGFTKIVSPGIFATTDFAWDSIAQPVPGTVSFTLAGRLSSFQGSLRSEISARSGRRVGLSLEKGRSIRTRVAASLADRADGEPRKTLELTVTRVD